jgi:hypothetical protein
MKLLPILLSVFLLSGCDTTGPLKGVDTTKKLEIDERLLAPPQSFPPRTEKTITEFDLLVEYADLAKAYSACYNNSVSLIKLLEGSNLVLKVPSTAIFMATPP